MFPTPSKKVQVMTELYIYKAKLLAIMGAVNASHPTQVVSETMEALLHALNAIIEGFEAGRFSVVVVEQFYPFTMPEEENEGDPSPAPENN